MATENLDSHHAKWSIIDKRRVSGQATSPMSSTTYNALRDNAAVDTALSTANAGYWTQARLDATMLSDKVYALRLLNDAAGIS